MKAPSAKELEKRLRNRHTEDEENLKKRIEKSKIELSFAQKADRMVINDKLERACGEAVEMVTEFLT